MRTNLLALFALLLSAELLHAQEPTPLQALARDFWTWRAQHAPFTGDDVNRIERPGGLRDWSAAAMEKRRTDLGGFESRWKQIDASNWPIPQQVDYRLIGSALARVHWELEINPRWKRDPNFYLEQTLTPVAEALTVPGPLRRSAEPRNSYSDRKYSGHSGKRESQPNESAGALRHRRRPSTR